MAKFRRKNEALLNWLRATGIALATYAALLGMQFQPGWGAGLLALVAGALTLAATDLGVLAALLAISLPLVAANPVVGITFLALGIVGIRYLGADGGRVFFVVAVALIGAAVGPVWAAPALAGLLIGAGEGALAAVIAAFTVEALGVVLGKEAIGATIAGAAKGVPLASFPAAAVKGTTYFSAEWLKKAFSHVGADQVNQVVHAAASTRWPFALAIQPAVWAAAAVLAGYAMREARKRSNVWIAVAGGVAAAILPAIGASVLGSSVGVTFASGSVLMGALTSAVIVGAVAFVWDRLFALERVATPATASSQSGSMAEEDADVDELLRLIATAEEKLTSQHTTTKVVMITDMKSFSRMTEEDGSILTAKAIQRHRDLLLPVIDSHHGHGKSTGGDGLVAAFETAGDAIAAAAEMQRALDHHNKTHPDDREMTVRIGVADGEVVLDKGGRPFIGAALNLAARVMSLADGGQAFATASVASEQGVTSRTVPLGEFELKNIAKPVEVVEILWADGQESRGAFERGTEA